MKIRINKVNNSTHLCFLAKAPHANTKENLSISVVDDQNTQLFTQQCFNAEDYEYTHWQLPDHPTTVFLEICDPAGELSLEYFVLYDSRNVMDEGVKFLRRENDLLFWDDQQSFAKHYAKNRYRPQFHFSAYKNWINDPNGLIFHNGYFHLFYQYYPHQPEWGNMHWGHAVSKDGVRWTHLPIALLPQIKDVFFGGSFSGSALVKDNKLTLIYTHHFEDARNKIKFQTSDFIENQELATSDDGVVFLRNEEAVLKWTDRPKLASQDFRDPKVWLDQDNQYKMILGSSYEGQLAVLIYSSSDLVTWNFAGPLYIEKEIHGRCIECPDLFPVGDKYVLIASIIETINGSPKHVTRYHIGEYRNNRFVSEFNQVIDLGPSFYAVQTFNYAGERRGIAWLDSWQDDKKSTAKEFAGIMSLPFTLGIKDNKLQIKPLAELAQLRKLPAVLSDQEKEFKICPESSFELKIRLKVARSTKSVKIHLQTYSDSEYIAISLDLASAQIDCTISEQDRRVNYQQQIAIVDDYIDLHLYFDRSAVELFCADYTLRGSFRFYWETELQQLNLLNYQLESGESAELYNLKSIWGEI